MTEKDLIDLGFDKFEQHDEEDSFYYYSYDLNDESGPGTLLSLCNDEIENEDWKVFAWDINENLVFDNVEDIKTYINVIEKNILTKEL